MSADAVRAFLSSLIDDAGLFPPARLAMADAVRAHRVAAGGDEAWLAGRFVVPASRLRELAGSVDEAHAPLAVAVVVDRPVADAAAFRSIASDATAVAARVSVETFELPLASIPGATDDDRCATLREAIAAVFARPPAAYVEVPAGVDCEAALLALHRSRERGFDVRAKIRCGGLHASAVPSPQHLAQFIWAANRLAVPFKATAGLHEALRHHDPGLGTDVHGFLNAIGAAVLVSARGLDRATLATLVNEREATAFTLDARRFAWRGIGADAAEIRQARASFVHGYGSCSFDEPVRDLRALAILPHATALR